MKPAHEKSGIQGVLKATQQADWSAATQDAKRTHKGRHARPLATVRSYLNRRPRAGRT